MNSLFRSLPAIANVFGIMVLVWLMFSIVAVQLFGGRFHTCFLGDTSELLDWSLITPDPTLTDNQLCTSYIDPITQLSGVWKRREDCRLNFDNVAAGMLTLFVVSTLEGWVDVMYCT